MTVFDFASCGRVGVLYGGTSAEREVSLESGQAVIESCRRLDIAVVDIRLEGENVIAAVQAANIDTAFIALHGGIGEDGRLQALLDLMGIAYTGSGVQPSVVAMNKLLSKQLWLGTGLKTPKFVRLSQSMDAGAVLADLGGRAMVKPAREGSSIGMAIANTPAELMTSYHRALQYDRSVLAEELLPGPEYTVAILDGEVLPPIQLETDHVFYDYDAKYLANDTRYLCPCDLSPGREEQLKSLAKRAFENLLCRGWGRVDLMVDSQGEFSLLEINTVPGMTAHSLVPMAARAAGYGFDELVGKILTGINRESGYD